MSDLGASRFAAIPPYRDEFLTVFGGEPTAERVALAIASYVRTILSGDAPYDRFAAGEAGALSPAARRGLTLFNGRALCVNCHPAPAFTDEAFHNIGIGMGDPRPDRGRYEVYANEADTGAFKTPTLRDVARRGPYMHDGSLPTLEEVIEHYAQGGTPNAWLSTQIRPLRLTRRDRGDLVAFLRALSGEVGPEVRRPPVLPH
jgi:cytochrome c peroxidase